MLSVNGKDYTQVAVNVKLTSPWNNGASTLTFECPAAKSGAPPNGCEVVFIWGEAQLFYGFLFSVRQGRDTVSCTAYDQLRYLKVSGFLLREPQPLGAFLNKAAWQAGERIRLGEIAQTAAPLKRYLFDGKTYLDMLYDSIEESLLLDGRHYTLRDEFGALCLRETLDLRLPLVLGEGSLATDYSFTRSIDEDTFNYIKVVRDNESSGTRDAYVAQDTGTAARWGRLMYTHKAQGETGDAQLAQLAKTILQLKNRESEALSMDCMGDARVLGGSGVKVELPAAGVALWAVVSRAVHTFEGGKHTMKLELQYGRWQEWML